MPPLVPAENPKIGAGRMVEGKAFARVAAKRRVRDLRAARSLMEGRAKCGRLNWETDAFLRKTGDAISTGAGMMRGRRWC